MSRPFIRANDGDPGIKYSATPGETITLTLDSIVGVRGVQWLVETTDETTTTSDYTLVQSGSKGQTCTFDALTAGTAVIIKVITNDGIVRSLPDPIESSNTIKIFVPTDEGLEVGTAGETYESDSLTATTGILNAPIRRLSAYTAAVYEGELKRAIVSSTTNLALTGDPGLTDGVTLTTGDIILLLGQTFSGQNGLWKVSTTGAWTRPLNFVSEAAIKGCVIEVIRGSDRGGFIYQNTNTGSITINSTGLTFLRLPDRYDRIDLGNASATPAANILARYNSDGGLCAEYFVANENGVAEIGLLRGTDQTTFIAGKVDTVDVGLLTWGTPTDELTVGAAAIEALNLSTGISKEIRMVDNNIEHRIYRAGRVVTLDATPTTLLMHTVENNTVFMIKALVTAISVTSDCSGFELTAVIKNVGSGATLVGSVLKLPREDDPATDADIIVSGDDFIVQVTGIAATNIAWNVSLKIVIGRFPSS